MLLAGSKYNEICSTLGVAKSTVAYHARKLGLVRGKPIIQVRYDWIAIQSYYDLGFCLAEVAEHFNMKRSTLSDAARQGRLTVIKGRCCKRPRYRRVVQNEELFVKNSKHDGSVVRNRIIRDDILLYTCHNPVCLLHSNVNAKWAGFTLALHLDHINGLSNDHRLENLRWLCPNCHSQTPTYCGRNKRVATGAGIEPAS